MNIEQKAKELIKKGERPDLRTRLGKMWKALKNENYGDVVKEVTDAMNIDQCDECKERQKAWNLGDRKDETIKQWRTAQLDLHFPYQWSWPTDEEMIEIEWFVNREDPSYISGHEQRRIIPVYNRILGKRQEVSSCGSCWMHITNHLHLIYEIMTSNGKA